MAQKRHRRHSQGFSMLEVLVAILAITAFLAGTLQLIAVNVLYKVKAEREAQANFWIQEDLEQVKSESAQLKNVRFCSSGSYTGDSNYTYTGTSTSNYSGSDSRYIKPLYAKALSDRIADLDSDSTNALPGAVSRKLVSKTYKLNRTYSTTDGSPYTLGITYEVTLATEEQADDYQNQERTIATRYAEVIPDASFNCNP